MAAVLRVHEYGRIHCGAGFSPESRTVTLAQHRELERFSESYRRTRGVTVFQNGPRNSLVAQNYVGVIQLGRHQVEVLPKIDGEDHEVRRSLVRMVAATLGLTLHADNVSALERTDHSILEVLIRLYCEQLWLQVRRGMLRRYEAREDNLVVLRGRLNVSRQLRHNLARPDRLHCTFYEFSEDNPLNRVLKAALRILLGAARVESTVRSVSELLFCFQDVSDVSPQAINWTQVGIDRLSERYAPLVRMSRLFLEGCSPDLIAGSAVGFAVLFDMNELFEEYVGRQARKVLAKRGLDVALQGPKRHLARALHGGRSFELRPDIVALDDNQPTIVIDTKWKRLREDAAHESVSSADMYQMFAYAQRYDVDQVILLYPHHSGLGSWKPRRAVYDVGGLADGAEMQRCVSVSTVDLLNLGNISAQLDAICQPLQL